MKVTRIASYGGPGLATSMPNEWNRQPQITLITIANESLSSAVAVMSYLAWTFAFWKTPIESFSFVYHIEKTQTIDLFAKDSFPKYRILLGHTYFDALISLMSCTRRGDALIWPELQHIADIISRPSPCTRWRLLQLKEACFGNATVTVVAIEHPWNCHLVVGTGGYYHDMAFQNRTYLPHQIDSLRISTSLLVEKDERHHLVITYGV